MKMKFATLLALPLATLAICQPAQADTITVGAELALTGDYAFAGVPARDGIMLALDEINQGKEAGNHTIKLLVEDTGSQKQQAITLMNRFASSDKALMVLGPSSSVEGVSVAPQANALKIPLLTTTALADDISRAGPWSFRTPTSPNKLVNATVDYIFKKGPTKNVSMVYLRDNEGQLNNKRVAEAAFHKGGAHVDSESVLGSDTDYQAILTKFLSKPMDVLYVSLTAEPSANFIIQARQAGLDKNVRIYGGGTMGAGRFIAVGGAAVEGVTFGADYFSGSKTPQNEAFVKAFTKRYKHMPDNYAALGYTATKLAARAIKAAGPHPTRDEVRNALSKIRNVPVILGNGKFSFDEGRNPDYGAVLLTVKNGKFTLAE